MDGFRFPRWFVFLVVDYPLEIELADDLKRFDVTVVTVINNLHQGAPPIEELDDRVHLVGNLTETLAEKRIVEGEHRMQRRKLLKEPTPFFHTVHTLKQELLVARKDNVLATDRFDLDVKARLGPEKEPKHRGFTL